VSGTRTKIHLLLVDDHVIVREGIRSTFRNHPEVMIVGDAATGREALAQAKKLSPDVVLMDINMPEMNGLEATAAMRDQFPAVKVIALTVHDSREYVLRILRAGAQGYVLKDASPDELLRAIRAAHSGQAFFSPSVSNIILTTLVAENSERETKAAGPLSVREAEVLRSIVKGRTTKEIAQDLNLGVRTVETYRARLMRKLNVRNVAELTRTAIARQLVS
jgi:two-component system, NarL family, nitrate/nitrite response regulator NarL